MGSCSLSHDRSSSQPELGESCLAPVNSAQVNRGSELHNPAELSSFDPCVDPHCLNRCFNLERSVAEKIIAQLFDESSGQVPSQNQLIEIDPAGKTLNAFLEEYPNPAEWFCKQYPYIKLNEVTACINPLGISFHVEGYAYGRFVAKEEIRDSITAPISLGVTLTSAKLPKELHSLFVVVNNGDGVFGQRSTRDIHITEVHEELHQLFNRFFCRAPFVSSPELADRIKKISLSNLKSHQDLAKNLADGMIELSRSEVISYFGTGEFWPGLNHVCGNFWREHFRVIRNYLSDKNASRAERKLLIDCYENSFVDYKESLREFIEFAKGVCTTPNELQPKEKVADLFYYSSNDNRSRRAA